MAENIEKKEELVLENAETESITVGMDVDLEDLIRQSERMEICRMLIRKVPEHDALFVREVIKIILMEDFKRVNRTEGQKC